MVGDVMVSDDESHGGGSPMGLWCFRAVFCSPLPSALHIGPITTQQCSGYSGGTFWSLSALGLGTRIFLVIMNGAAGGSHAGKTQFHSIGFHLPLSQLHKGAWSLLLQSCFCCWKGLCCGEGMGVGDGLSQAASEKTDFSCLSQRVSGSGGVSAGGSGCLRSYVLA